MLEDLNGIPPLDEPTYEKGTLQTEDISLTELLDDLVAHYNGGVLSIARGAPAPGGAAESRQSEAEEGLQAKVALHPGDERAIGVYPNPSAGATNVRFTLAEAARSVLSIYDVSGHRVHRATLEGHAGENVYQWDGFSLGKGRAKAGTYLVRVEAEGRVATSKLVLL